MRPITTIQAKLIGAAAQGRPFSYRVKLRRSGLKGIDSQLNPRFTARLLHVEGEVVWIEESADTYYERIRYNEDLIRAKELVERLSPTALIQLLDVLEQIKD